MTDTELRETVFAIVAKTFKVNVDELTNSTQAEDVDGWDSLAHATLLIRIQKSFNIKIDTDAANKAQNLEALIAIVHGALR